MTTPADALPPPAANHRPLRVAVCWPAPRLDRIIAALANPARYEEMDGLSYLPSFGIQVSVIDASTGWRNPLAQRGSLLAGIDPWRFVKQLWHYRQFDVLVSADSSACLLFVLTKRLLGLKKPVLVIDPALDPGYRNRMRLHQLVLPHVQAVLVFGKVQVQLLQRLYGNRINAQFIRHRMDARFFDPAKCTPQRPNEPYILSVGNDVGRDFDTLVAAAAHLAVRVVLHTRRPLNGPLPPNVQVQSHRISFEALRDLYAGAALVIVPLRETIHASGTNGLLEAMTQGRPVVVSASSGIVDYVTHQATAWVVPTGDVKALQNGIQHLLDHPEQAQAMGERARTYCEQHLSMPVYAAQVAQVIRDVSPRQPVTSAVTSPPSHQDQLT